MQCTSTPFLGAFPASLLEAHLNESVLAVKYNHRSQLISSLQTKEESQGRKKVNHEIVVDLYVATCNHG